MHLVATAAAAIALLAAFAAGEAGAAECNSLAGRSFGDARVVETSEIAGGTFSTSPRQRISVNAPMCRVKGTIKPVKESYINFEMWLPPAASWNGKYVGVGNGAFSGAIMYDEMQDPFARGYAVSSTDAGHTEPGSAWAMNQIEKIHDWGWRAHHMTALVSKQIVQAYYGAAPKYSYFLGCSKGGTNSLMEAQRFPDDYDGIIAGAPGWDQSGQVTGYLWTQQAITAAPGGWMSRDKLTMLNKAVLAACNAKLGYVEDPNTCKFDPGVLLCKGPDSNSCLTAPQVSVARKFYSGPVDEGGKAIYSGFARGSELQWGSLMGPEDRPGVGAGIFGSLTGYLRDFLYWNSDWDFRTLKVADVKARASEKLGVAFDAVNYDLGAFSARGGKLIHFMGWNDVTVRPGASQDYFDRVAAKMGGVRQVNSFYRLFMAPGMNHCSGGLGPYAVSGPHNALAPTRDPKYDIVSALEEWVERGRAPEQLIATSYVEDDPAKGIAAQRPWCVYPATARHRRGDPKQASSYICSEK